ncbi:hypothetical protein DFR67_11976 [Williamsia limnetica]|uniref:MspA protein n=1 Tax=Williamsia limnetica TaxID=882452 RepID=A0A318RUE6_WILLI|nr:hypothetical protein DFR67_11976 [Williamsia limnetica]
MTVRRSRVLSAALLTAFAVTAVGAGSVAAAPNSFADRTVTKSTDDGWQVSVTKASEKLRSVPPLNQSQSGVLENVLP